MSAPDRTHAGVPTGGQFAAAAKAESGVSLAPEPSTGAEPKPLTPAQESYAELRRMGRVTLGYEERDRILPALRRMAKAEGLAVSAMLSEPGRGNTRLSKSQLRTRPTYVCLVRPENPTFIYAPDSALPAETGDPT